MISNMTVLKKKLRTQTDFYQKAFKCLNSPNTKLTLLALPFVILIFLFNYLPIFGWAYAFIDYSPGVPILSHKFVGLKHFISLFSGGSEFINVLINTMALSLLGIITSPVPVIFAIMLGEVRFKKLSKVMQTITSLPNFISWILVYSVFFVFFSQEEGVVNVLLMKWHLISQNTNFLGNEGATWIFQTIIGLWKNVGWSAIIYLAAISGIDTELYDAASVDGAGRLRKIWSITVPGIMPTFIVLLLFAIGGMLSNGFEQYYVFDNPLVHNKINVLDTYVYYMGIGHNQYSFSTAVGIFKTAVSLVLLFMVNGISKKARGTSII